MSKQLRPGQIALVKRTTKVNIPNALGKKLIVTLEPDTHLELLKTKPCLIFKFADPKWNKLNGGLTFRLFNHQIFFLT